MPTPKYPSYVNVLFAAKPQRKAAKGKAKVKPASAFARYWAGSVSQSVMNDYAAGRVKVIQARAA